MTPAELRTMGERLYGPRWQTKLARALEINQRTVRRWLAGSFSIRPPVAMAIRALIGDDPPKRRRRRVETRRRP